MPTITIRIPLKREDPYRVIFERGLFQKIPELLKRKKWGARFCIITDQKLKKLYGETLLKRMKTQGLRTALIELPPGESAKKLSLISQAAEALLKFGMKRDGLLLALGGGSISDVTGFLASIYMRGIPYVMIPTTLLSMADSCLGGKTGVDLERGKNLLGTFYQPKEIFIDPNLLKTLPERSYKCGFSEIIKHAVIGHPMLFRVLEKNGERLKSRNTNLLSKVILMSLKIKQKIIERDPHEEVFGGRPHRPISRMMLNYGHTVGHALEKLSNSTLPHGEAIAIGMVAENRIAVGKGMLSEEAAERVKKLITSYSLPAKIPKEIPGKSIISALQQDKKSLSGKVFFALPKTIGKVVLRNDLL